MTGFVPQLVTLVGYGLIGTAVAGIAVGWGLLVRTEWARLAALVLGALSLLDVPFGTILGIYTFWVLLPAESEVEFRNLSAAAQG